MEHGHSSKSKKNKFGKGSKLGPKGVVSKKPKFQGKCFNYDKVDHKSADCRLQKKKNNYETNIVDNITQDVAKISLSVVASKVNMVGSNPREWWIDVGATRHVRSDREMFTTFEPIIDGGMLFIRNSATSAIQGREM